ncbi:hypothetical protein VTN49DRAFT_7065 [Thermomyces lanuginosus]|uniref:uncharacterized protein n=1 Tax=Thermomyces lanuginosus TaxID=5541 RepID=UPI0037433801
MATNLPIRRAFTVLSRGFYYRSTTTTTIRDATATTSVLKAITATTAGPASFSSRSYSTPTSTTSSQPENNTPPSTTTPTLNENELPDLPLRTFPSTRKVGRVIATHTMQKTARVAHKHITWDKHIRKFYPKVTTYLVHDPRGSLREGDVIEFSSGARRSPRVRHVVEKIIAPFGTPLEERPPVMTPEERERERLEERWAKLQRRAQRQGRDVNEVVEEAKEKSVGRIKKLVQKRLEESGSILSSSSSSSTKTESA